MRTLTNASDAGAQSWDGVTHDAVQPSACGPGNGCVLARNATASTTNSRVQIASDHVSLALRHTGALIAELRH